MGSTASAFPVRATRRTRRSTSSIALPWRISVRRRPRASSEKPPLQASAGSRAGGARRGRKWQRQAAAARISTARARHAVVCLSRPRARPSAGAGSRNPDRCPAAGTSAPARAARGRRGAAAFLCRQQVVHRPADDFNRAYPSSSCAPLLQWVTQPSRSSTPAAADTSKRAPVNWRVFRLPQVCMVVSDLLSQAVSTVLLGPWDGKLQAACLAPPAHPSGLHAVQ